MSDPSKQIDEFELKAKWPILSYAVFFAPKAKFSGEGRWRSGACPWAPGLKMWLDVQENTWHVKGYPSGDVLDWHAAWLRVDRAAAAQDLASYHVAVLS